MEKIKETIRRFISKKDYDRVNHLLLVNESLEEDYKLAISALIDSRTGNHANAKTKYEKSLAIKDSPAVHLNYATFLFETGEHECAEEHFKSACKSEELLVTALSNLCLFYLKTKKKHALDDIFQNYKHLRTSKLIAPFLIAEKFKVEKELAENLIASFSTDRETVLLTCIDILVQHYSFEEAVEFYSSYPALVKYKALRKRICLVGFKANNFLFTINEAKLYLDNYEYEEPILKALVHSYLNLGMYKELDSEISILRKKFPCGHLIYTNAIGLGAMKVGKYNTARRHFLELFIADRTNWQNIINLSSAQIEANRRSSALVSLNRAEKIIRSEGSELDNLNPRALHHVKINRASILTDIGMVDQSHEIIDSLIDKAPNDMELVKKKLFSAGYTPNLDTESVFELFVEYKNLLERTHPKKTYKKAKEKKTRPSICYISGDVCRSSVSSFLLPLVMSHGGRSEVDVLVIHTGTRSDDVTRMYSETPGCHVFLAPQATAISVRNMLQSNDVDLVIDCTGVTRGARPEVFTGDQMPYALSTFLGHGYTSGNPFIDFVLAPRSLIPVEEEMYYTEQVIPFEGAFAFPYLALKPLDIKKNLSSEHIALGCVSRPIRISQPVFSTYAKILNANSDISLIFGSTLVKDHFVVQKIISQFAKYGVCPTKLKFVDGSINEIFQQIDIFLDQWPQNSGTTIIESLLCGVPVVTKIGKLSYGKIGSTILSEIDKQEWIANSEDQFADIVNGLIIQLRKNGINSIEIAELARERLTDATKFSQAIEILAKRILNGGSSSRSSR